MSLGKEYITSVIKRLKYYKELGDKTFDQLSNDEDLHFRPNDESNSIAQMIQHMAGNMISRWTDLLTTDGEKKWRDRDAEFEINDTGRQALKAYWEKGWDCCLSTLEGLCEDDLLKTIHIRGEALLVVDAINRQLAHYPYHVGQIIYLAKIIQNEQWTSLSIPKGRSKQFNTGMKDKPSWNSRPGSNK